MFLRKYNPEGKVEWTRQFGTTGDDGAGDVAVGGDGSVFVTGTTHGALPGKTNKGSSDAFIRKCTPQGKAGRTSQFGSIAADSSWGVDVVLAPRMNG